MSGSPLPFDRSRVWGSSTSEEAPPSSAAAHGAGGLASPSLWSGWSFLSGNADADAKPAPLPPGTLPEVRMEDFSRYLSSVGEKLASFERDKATAQLWVHPSVSREEGHDSQGHGLVAAMDEVPAVYFRDDFDLDRAELWADLGNVHSDTTRQAALDRLSHYLDAVETYLVQEIAARYDSFFDASGYVQELGGSVYRLYQQVAEMRARVALLEREAGSGVQMAASLQRRQANMLATLETLKVMEGVAHAQAALQAIMSQAGGIAVDFAGAIDILEVLQSAADNSDVLALRCFRGLPAQIRSGKQVFADLMTSDFLERTAFAGRQACLNAILDRLTMQVAQSNSSNGGIAAVIASLPQQKGRAAQEAASLRCTDIEAVRKAMELLQPAWLASVPMQEELLPLVMGLQRLDHFLSAVHALQEASCEEMRSLVGDMIDGCLAVLGQTQDSLHLLPGQTPPKPIDKLPRLSSERFIWVLEATLLAMAALLQHCDSISTSVTAVLRQADLPDARRTLADCCQAVAEAAAGRWSKMLAARAQSAPTSTSRLVELRNVLDMTDVLASLMEAHGVRSVLGLRTALQQLCKVTLESMHQQSISKLTTLLEQEHWTALEVAPQCQSLVDALEHRMQAGDPHTNGSATPGSTESNVPAATLRVAAQHFHIVHTEQLLLGMLREYLAFRDAVPAFGGDVAQRVLELLKIFNSKACQLVLGAGAMQVSGLKSITAKHLAVCSQSVSALIALHPALVSTFLQGVPPPRADMLLAGFKRSLQDFEIHCDEIRGKLVSMMRDRLAANVKQLPVIAASWPGAAAAGGLPQSPSSFAATTVKQLQILAGVLSPLMLPGEVRSIMGSIAGMFSSALAEAYDDLQPHGEAWQAQMLADLECFLKCLRELPMEPQDREANLGQLEGMYSHHLRRSRLAAPAEQRTLQPEAAPAQPTPAKSAPAAAAAVETVTALPLGQATVAAAPAEQDAPLPAADFHADVGTAAGRGDLPQPAMGPLHVSAAVSDAGADPLKATVGPIPAAADALPVAEAPIQPAGDPLGADAPVTGALSPDKGTITLEPDDAPAPDMPAASSPALDYPAPDQYSEVRLDD